MVSSEKRILVVLDLDETLIHCSPFDFKDDCDFSIDENRCQKRKGLEEFIRDLSYSFDLAIWSSAPDDYVEKVSKAIKPKEVDFKFVWGRSKCTLDKEFVSRDPEHLHDENFIKDLSLIAELQDYAIEKILIVDDSPQKARLHLNNLICVNRFTGGRKDNELAELKKYLMTLKDIKDVRYKNHTSWEYETQHS